MLKLATGSPITSPTRSRYYGGVVDPANCGHTRASACRLRQRVGDEYGSRDLEHCKHQHDRERTDNREFDECDASLPAVIAERASHNALIVTEAVKVIPSAGSLL
jgi:hypothetical protein